MRVFLSELFVHVNADVMFNNSSLMYASTYFAITHGASAQKYGDITEMFHNRFLINKESGNNSPPDNYKY